MPLSIVRYEPQHEAAVAAFNERGRANNAPFSLSKTATASWLPKHEGAAVFREFFLAIDGAEVRGGFTLRRQDFWLNGNAVRAANYQGPLSEGIWDRRYMMAGVQLLRAALREEPLLYALGMGGMSQPLPKLLASAGWSLAPVPFFFKVLQPSKFLRHIQPLRRQKSRARVLDLAAATGLGSLGLRALQFFRTKHRLARVARCEVVTRYDSWTDEVWTAARDGIAFCAVRDAAGQNAVFGDGNAKNMTLRCTRDGRDIGWAVVRSTPMQGDKYFGDMRVGSIVDCLAVPGSEGDVLALAERHLRQLGSDLIVSNQSLAAWCDGLKMRGFFNAPSNFLFAASPELAGALGPLDKSLARIHFDRADGDGPIHL